MSSRLVWFTDEPKTRPRPHLFFRLYWVAYYFSVAYLSQFNHYFCYWVTEHNRYEKLKEIYHERN